MNTEQKAKAYDEALERAREWHNDPYITIGLKGNLEDIFPELKENEDGDNKRISKEITRFLKQNNGWNREWLDWLEKQSEQKPAWSEEDEAMLDTMGGWLDTLCEYLKDSSSEYIPNVESCINWLKQLKQRIGR